MRTPNPIFPLPYNKNSQVVDIFFFAGGWGGHLPITNSKQLYANKLSHLNEMDKLLKLTKDKTQILNSHITRILNSR